jgi:hypothetical protein
MLRSVTVPPGRAAFQLERPGADTGRAYRRGNAAGATTGNDHVVRLLPKQRPGSTARSGNAAP